jgi:cytochrome c biogenesis protein CcmG/thiol:disulfide interchange protein DsbE
MQTSCLWDHTGRGILSGCGRSVNSTAVAYRPIHSSDHDGAGQNAMAASPWWADAAGPLLSAPSREGTLVTKLRRFARRGSVAVAVLVLGVMLAACGSSAGSGSVGSGFTLAGTTLDGQAFDLSAYKGKPVVINYWATWCGYCVQEMPELVAFTAAHPEVQVIGVNVQDDAAAARQFVAQQGLTFPQVSDPQGKLLQTIGSQGIPTTLFLDAGLVVREKIVGATDRTGFEAGLKKAQ